MNKELKLNIYSSDDCFFSGVLPETLGASGFTTETPNAFVTVNNFTKDKTNVQISRNMLPTTEYHIEPFKENGVLYFKVPYFDKKTAFCILEEKGVFDSCKMVLPLYHTDLDFSSLDKTFMDQYNEMWERNQHIPETDLEFNEFGNHRLAVIRPTNFTLGLFAFVVEFPEYFRRHEFQVILYEFSVLWKNAREGIECPQAAETLKERVAGCGLRAVNPAVYKLTASELLKTGIEAPSFMLTPYIQGRDMRILRAGDQVYTHTGTLSIPDLRDGSAYKIEPISLLDTDEHGELASDVIDIFRTLGIMLSGSIDLRETDGGDNYYFLEASPSFNAVHYSEEFIRTSAKEVLTVIDQAWLHTKDVVTNTEVTE